MHTDILHKILCMLPIKDLVATSSISTQWRYLWCNIFVKLIFDGTEKFENMAKDPKLHASQRKEYVAKVNSVIEDHHYPAILEFRIRFDLDNENKKDIDEWLQFAVEKKVQILELDLNKIGKKVGFSENYRFPSQLLDLEAELPVWLPCPNSKLVHIPFLRKLFLKSVDMPDAILQQLITYSPNLETLSLHSVGLLRYVDIFGQYLKLKYLEVVSCLNVRFIHLYSFDLESFVYKGRPESFRLEYLDMLRVLDIGEGVFQLKNHLFFEIRSCISSIQEFSFNINFSKKKVNLSASFKLPNVKNLRLTIGACRDESLLDITDFAKACPSLEKLTIELIWLSRIKKRTEILRHNASKPHRQLKTLEIKGYLGRISDFVFALHIIENASELKKILIDTHRPKGATSIIKNLSKKEEAARSSAIQQFKSIPLKDDVDLVIL